jgi:hypothetical protein
VKSAGTCLLLCSTWHPSANARESRDKTRRRVGFYGPLGFAAHGRRSSRQNLCIDARTSPRVGSAAASPSPSGVRRESFSPRARGVASIHTNAPMDSAESPRGIVVGNAQHSRTRLTEVAIRSYPQRYRIARRRLFGSPFVSAPPLRRPAGLIDQTFVANEKTSVSNRYRYLTAFNPG